MRNGALPLHYAHLSGLLAHCGRDADLCLGASLHAAIVKNAAHFQLSRAHPSLRHVLVAWNALISMYSRCGRLRDAARVFDEMRLRDSVSWNSLISGCKANGHIDCAFRYFKRMLHLHACAYDHATFTTILSACAQMGSVSACAMVHKLVVSSGFEREVSVGNALVTSYFECGSPALAGRVFDQLPERNVITWTAMVSGMARGNLYKESLLLFREMRHAVEANDVTYSSSLLACAGLLAVREGQQVHGLVVKAGFETDLRVESALMDVYSKCSLMEDALWIFRSCRDPDEVFFTVILAGFAQNGLEEKAFELFAEMVGAGFYIDANMVSAVLGAFGASAPFILGRQIHALVIKKCFGSNTFVCNGLMNMYSKCGELSDSVEIFNQMSCKNSVSWNSMIAAFARHGHGLEVFRLFESMKADGVKPTDVTFLSLLHACSHVGSAKRGIEILNSMASDHGIAPQMKHYACVVDMLGRAGLLDEAKAFIEEAPIKDNALLWQALLGACSFHGNLEIGKYAAEKLLVVAPRCSAAYVLLANIYSSEGRWEERARLIKQMRELGVKKDTGKSWIEVDKEVRAFIVGSKVHPETAAVDEILLQMFAVSSDQEDAVDEFDAL